MSDSFEASQDRARSRLRRLAWLLDSSIRLPGGFRVGLDGIIGLIPGVGDVLAAGLSAYIIAEAARLNVPASVLSRMGLNVLLELLVGVIPVLGDVFDFVFKANERNVALLDAHLQEPRRTHARSRWVVAAVALGLLLLLCLALAVVFGLLRLVWSLANA